MYRAPRDFTNSETVVPGLGACCAVTHERANTYELAKGRLRTKKAELQAALHGRVRPQHTRLLTHILTHLEFLEETIASCEAEMEELGRPLAEEIALLDTAPGVSTRTAQDLLAEIGVALEHFPSARHLGSWAKLSPGNNESAGKRRSGQTGHGNK